MGPFKREIEGEYRGAESFDLDWIRPFPGAEDGDLDEHALREEAQALTHLQELEPLVLIKAIASKNLIANAIVPVDLSYYLLSGQRQLWLYRNSPVRVRLSAFVFRVPKKELKNVRYRDGKVFIEEQA